MPNLNYIACGFPSNWDTQLHGSHSVNVTWAELVWAAITVGRKSWGDVIQHGPQSRLEMVYRSAILMANLSSSSQRGFTKTDAYKSLDPSEKSAISYFLGLSFAKLAAQRLLGIPWLVHLDRFSDLPIGLKGSRRPDLIGENFSGEWSVFEAKGRTNRIDQRTIQKAKEQTRMLRQIDGKDPSVRVASISHFFNDTLDLHLEDPDEVNPDAVDFKILGGEDKFLEYYYQPFVSLIENNRTSHEEVTDQRTDVVSVGGRVINVVSLAEVDLVVGLDSQMQETLKNTDRLRPRLLEHLEGIGQSHSANSDTDSFIGLDGIFVRLGASWDIE